MTDREIISEYRNDVFVLHSLRLQIAWNLRHGLPIFDMPEKITQIRNRLAMFGEILDRIPDRRTRNIIRCRFALGMDVYSIAEYMRMSGGHVERIVIKTMKETEHRRTMPK